jgi:hypothetical protein
MGEHWIDYGDIDYYDSVDDASVLALMYCSKCGQHEWHWISKDWMLKTKPVRHNPNLNLEHPRK